MGLLLWWSIFLFAQRVFCDVKMNQIVVFCLKDVVNGSGIPLKHPFKRTSIFQVWLLLSVTMSRRPRIIQRRFDNCIFSQLLGPLTVLLIPFPFLLVHRSQTLQVWDSFLTCCLRVFWQWFLATKTCGFSFLFNRHNSLIKSNTTKARFKL